MKLFPSMNHPGVWITTIMASSILMITMGTRQSMGLYVGPLNTDTGLGIVSISLAMAIGQFMWGAIQPVAGAFADKFGPRPVLLSGLLILVLGSALTPFVSSQLGLILTLGLLTAIGSGACSFSVLLGAVAQRMPATSRGTASGIINAGSSFGQFVFAPIIGKLIQWVGWMSTMWAMAAVVLLAIPLLNRLTNDTHAPAAAPTPEGGLKKAVADALRNPSYLLLHLGFFYMRLSHCIFSHPFAHRGRLVRAIAYCRQLVIGLHWFGQHCGQLVCRFVHQSLSQQIRVGSDVWLAGRAHCFVLGGTQN